MKVEFSNITTFECAVCGNEVCLKNSNVCPNCEWEEDTLQEHDPDAECGANFVSLNHAKANYTKCGKIMTDEDVRRMNAYYEEYRKEFPPPTST